jgi:cell division protein YceG involved in septum cleavage
MGWEGPAMTISGKRYKVKHRSRFTLFIAFLIVFIVMVSNTFLGLNNASSFTQQEYIEITIQHGDTLWNIARKYMPENNDIRKAVHTLCNINEIYAHELKAGQILLIPVN